MVIREAWEFRFKAFAAAAAATSALSIVIGGVVGLYTFRQQGLAAAALKVRELRLIQYNEKKAVYYELVDAAATVAMSLTKEEAKRNAAKYSILYFGKAHIFAIDPSVRTAKITFHTAMAAALAAGDFPSYSLQKLSLELAAACSEVLQAENVFAQD
jgi:hypothetical protein